MTNQPETGNIVVLSSNYLSMVIDLATSTPTILHWGSPIAGDPSELRAAIDRPIAHGMLDVVAPLSVVPEHGSGHHGRPGLEGRRRSGTGWAPRFEPSHHTIANDATGTTLRATSIDVHEALELSVTVEVRTSGVARVKSVLTNNGSDDYELDALRTLFPTPSRARETLTFSGRWTKEFTPIRQVLETGLLSVENRSGRTSNNRTPIAFVGTCGFTNERGEVWGAHLEWSGNSRVCIEAQTDRRRSLQLEELLLPGEVVLGPGATYETPWVVAAHSTAGTNGLTASFHRELRSRPNHPKTNRPITLNIWEAVYFDHDLDRLLALANRASAIGVERFVVDDGWFHLRRNDKAGLGDWWVDPSAWPNGLGPIADHVVGLGMEFGLWFEPEMVNPDSDLYRAHPEWVLVDQRYKPILGRDQLLLDLGRVEVREYLFEKIDALLSQYPISYIKWDMNREIVHGSSNGRAGVHAQTRGVYDLLGRLRHAHPGVEIESCSSGGARIDFAILEWTSRFWASDCNDPLERQRIQNGFSHIFPPELMGSHIGPPMSHTTARTHRLAMRASTAFFGHLGIEWNVLECTDEEVRTLTNVLKLHKQHRSLLHSGTVVRLDQATPNVLAHGVISADRTEALLSVTQMDSTESLAMDPLTVAGLLPTTNYRVEIMELVDAPFGSARRQPQWVRDGGLVMSGSLLAEIGFQPPIIHPESAVLFHLIAVQSNQP